MILAGIGFTVSIFAFIMIRLEEREAKQNK
jgi:Na+/H+ antiporter NhaA